MALRLVFMGTPDFAVPALEALLAAGHTIVAVYTQPPRPAGRGHLPQPSPVQRVAESHRLTVRTPKSLRDPEAQQAFAALQADAAVVVAYGLILPVPILRAPRLGCYNLHASLLPRWRGAAPIQRAILAGDSESGVCIMRMDEGLDTGPVLVEQRVPIGPRMTASELHDALAGVGAARMVEALAMIERGEAEPKPQPSAGATYAGKIGKDEGRIDWRRPAAELDRLVRALGAAPGVWFQHGGERIKVLAVEPIPDGGGEPGTVLDDRLTVACGRGALRLLKLQRAGKAALAADAFQRGYVLPAGTRLD